MSLCNYCCYNTRYIRGKEQGSNFQKNGYVVFLRNTVPEESFNLNNCEHYHKEVYKPCMYYIQKVMHRFDNDEKV